MKIAVTGATGQLGHHIINHLLELGTSPSDIYAIARRPEKAQDLKTKDIHVVYGDYSKPETMTEALKGIDKLMLVSGSEVGQRVTQHKAIIDAAKANGVRFIAYTSLLKADDSELALADEHRITEKMVKESGIDYSFLRNGWYSENYLSQLPIYLETGVILGSAKEGKYSAAPRTAYALAAAKVLTQVESPKNIYELASDYHFTLSELASEISKVAGKEVLYINLPEKEYTEKLISFNVPGPFAEILANSDAKAAKGDLYSNSTDLTDLIGKKVTPLKEQIKSFL